MDFSRFIPQAMIPSLHWLGRRDWIEYGDIANERQIWGRPKELVILKPGETPASRILSSANVVVPTKPWLNKPDKIYVTQDEFKKYPITFWDETRHILSRLSHNVVSTFLMYTMSKSLADGAKVFRATTQQCLDLASDEGEMSCDYPFADYLQPYPVFILELPVEYQTRLKALFKTTEVPTHVFCQHEPGKMIMVSAFFKIDNVVTHLTPNRAEYESLEDAIISNRRKPTIENGGDPTKYHDTDFDVAELVQRLAINFGMWMTFIGTHVKGPLDPEEAARLKELSKTKSSKPAKLRRAAQAKSKMLAGLNQIVFNQVVEFHDEIVEVDQHTEHQGGTHKSPRPHRRKAHWRNQVCGPKNAERKWIPIKAVIVRKAAFVGDPSQMTTTYITKKKQ
jgi:hypothetical protein